MPFTSNPQYNSDILKAITANPNVPTDLLMELGADFPQQMLDNPIFNLLWVENPNFILIMPNNTLISLLGLKSTPKYILEEILKRRNCDLQTLCLLIAHPNSPPSVLDDFAKSTYAELRNKVASNPKTPANILKILAQDNHAWVRNTVATNPQASDIVLEILSRDKEEWIRRTIACHPNTPKSLREILAQDEDGWVRYHATKHL